MGQTHSKSRLSMSIFLKLIGLYYKELIENYKTDEELYLNVGYWKQTLTHQQLIKLISYRAHLL